MSLYHARWYVLFTFCLFAFINGTLWMTFGCVPQSTEHIYDIEQDQVDLLLNWGPIVCVIFIPVTTWLLTKKNGFKHTVRLGYTMTFVGSVVRTIPTIIPGTHGRKLRHSTWGLAFLHLGQIISAGGGTIAFGTATRLSSEWFPDGQRTRATAAIFVSNALGIALMSTVGPYLVRWTSLAVVLYLLAGLASISFLCSIVYFPSPPEMHPNPVGIQVEDQADKRLLDEPQDIATSKATFYSGLRIVLTNYSTLVLCLGSGVMGGVTNAYLGVLPTALNNKGESEYQGDRLNAIFVFAGVVGGFLLGDLTDRFFRFRLKDMLIFIAAASFAFFMALIYIVYMRHDLFWLQDLMVLGAGLMQGACGPLAVELAAELTYPADEGTSAGVYAFFFNIGALALIFIAPQLPVTWLGIASLASIVLALMLYITITETYLRHEQHH